MPPNVALEYSMSIAILCKYCFSTCKKRISPKEEEKQHPAPSPASPPSGEAPTSSPGLRGERGTRKIPWKLTSECPGAMAEAMRSPRCRKPSVQRAVDKKKYPCKKGGRVHSMSCSTRGGKHGGRMGPEAGRRPLVTSFPGASEVPAWWWMYENPNLSALSPGGWKLSLAPKPVHGCSVPRGSPKRT